jgi:diguanylate cyclase (GGDEF)-like protein/PAS domain S-box-containing protein
MLSTWWFRLRTVLPRGRPLSNAEWADRQRWMGAIVVGNVLVVSAIAALRAPDHLIFELAPICFGAWVATSSRFRRDVRTVASTLALASCSALLVHVTDGLIESHFHFFAVIALLSLYREWLPFALGFVYVTIHHAVVGVVVPTAVYNHQAAWERPVLWAGIHGGYVVLAAVANLLSWRLGEQERDRADGILASVGEALYTVDRCGIITWANPAMATLAGRSGDELVGARQHDVLGHDRAGDRGRGEGCRLCIAIMAATEERRDDHVLVRRDGTVIPVEFSSHPARWEGAGRSRVVAIRDITERRVFEHQLRHQALHDPLTGLPNRALLLDRLGVAIANLRRLGGAVGVLFVDVDDFKQVNDTYGHAVGDELLEALAGRLCEAAPGDATIARLGGDEFVVCIPLLDPGDDFAASCESLRALLARPVVLSGRRLQPGISVGTAICRDADQRPEELLRRADVAKNVAQEAGGARVAAFEQGIHSDDADRREQQMRLRLALDAGELVLHYQTTHDVDGLGATGVEALIRWQHPERGLVGPGAFIPLAERSSLIVDIGSWVLTTACAQVARWNRRRAVPLHVAVNVSARQLAAPNFVGTVDEALRSSGLDPRHLVLEITETVLVDRLDVAAPVLEELRARGIRIALDDFGTGYSSLTYLQRLPVDIVKIDRSFVGDLDQTSESHSVVSAIMQLAQSMGVHTVAEGVERVGQLRVLRQVGCDTAQGFLLGHPSAARELEQGLTEPSRLSAVG